MFLFDDVEYIALWCMLLFAKIFTRQRVTLFVGQQEYCMALLVCLCIV